MSVRPGTISASVIIPAHNAEGTLARQLDALAAQVGAPTFDVTVVANCCTDNTADVALRYFAGSLAGRVVQAPRRASAGYARNLGVRHCQGEVLLFCDADDVVGDRWVAEMYRRCATDEFDVVGGRLCVDRTGISPWRIPEGYRTLDGVCSLEMFGHRYAITASMACRREVFDHLGGFDEALPDGAGAEDTDFGIRRSLEGFSFAEAPGATVSYQPRVTIRSNAQRAYRYSFNGQALAEKYGMASKPTLLAVVAAPARSMAYAVLVNRTIDPRAVALRGVVATASHFGRWRFYRLTLATRRRSLSRGADQSSTMTESN